VSTSGVPGQSGGVHVQSGGASGAPGASDPRAAAPGKPPDKKKRPDPPCRAGAGCVSSIWIVVLVVVVIVEAVLCLYGLWAIWPSPAPSAASGAAKAASNSAPIILLRQHFKITTDEQLFILVALAGALGGLVHTLRSLGWYVGNRHLRWSWIAFYMLLPVIGAAGGTIFYVVTRAGLVSASSAANDQLNPFGLAAVAALVGLFSEQAIVKLKAVAGTVFSEAEKGVDAVPETTGTGAADTGGDQPQAGSKPAGGAQQ
jgi:hypothetical protein